MDSGRIRVLYLLWSGGLGGAERHVYDLVTGLAKDRFEPSVCFFSRAHTYGPLLTQAGIPVTEMDLHSGYDLPGAVRFVRWLRQANFDLVHDHASTPWARLAVGFATPNAISVYTEHSREYRLVQRLCLRLSDRYTSRHIAVSLAARDAFAKATGVAPSRISIIPNFADAERFQTLSNVQITEIRRSLGLPDEAVVLISVGRLVPTKNFERLITALVPLLSRRPELYLLIVGDGPLRELLATEVARIGMHDRIRILGDRLDVPALLGACNLFVSASEVETFGIAVLEAMMAGIPVVALNIPGLDEVVESGNSGILVGNDDFDSQFTTAIADLVDNLETRAQMGGTARQRAMELFERRKVIDHISCLYHQIMHSGAP